MDIPYSSPSTQLLSIATPPTDQNSNSDQDSLNQGMLTSPSPIFRLPSFTKRKKGSKPNIKKQQAIEKKYQTLMENLTPIPFSPSIILYFSKYENLLRRLGLWEFVHTDFDRTIRTDLIAQLVASYDSKARCSYVNGARVMVNRADLGRAFKLPVKKEKGVGVGEGVEDDLNLLTEESIGFIENLVSYWMLLHDDTWMMPSEVLNWMKVIREGYPENVDWAGLLWFMVEKELTQGERLVDCYYASHLQYLITYQHEEVVFADEPVKVEEVVFADEPVKVDLDGEEKEKVVDVNKEGVLQTDCTDAVPEEVDVGVESAMADLVEEEKKVEEVDVGVEYERVDLVEKQNNEDEVDIGVEYERVDEKQNNAEEVGIGVECERVDSVDEQNSAVNQNSADEVEVGVESVRVHSVEEKNTAEEVGVESERVHLVEGEDKAEEVYVGVESKSVDLIEEVNKSEAGVGSLEVDSLTDIRKEDVDVPETLNIELNLGGNTGPEEIVEEGKVHHVVMMDVEEGNEHAYDDISVPWQLDPENTVSEHSLRRCNMEIENELFNYEDIKDEAEDIEDEEGGEEADDTFDILENHDTLVGDGITGNFLQAMQVNKLPFSSHEQFDQPDIGFVASRNDMQHNNSSGPSFYDNGGKRAVKHMSEDGLNGNNKRLRINGPWNHEPPNFTMYMEGIEQFVSRATMMYEAKEQSLEQSNMNQQILLDEVQKRDSIMEHLQKSRSVEMQKKDEEIYRLERELYAMGNLLDGYRDALKGTQKAFADYKKHFALPEESIYKDAGPGGVMLTTEAIEKHRLKQQEDHRTNCLVLEQKAKEAEEVYARQFAAFLEKVCKLDDRLVGLENEMIELKKSSGNREVAEAEQPICSKTSMTDNLEGTENEHPISNKTNMIEQLASSDTDMTDNCEGKENEEPASSMLEQPGCSDTDMPEKCRGIESEQTVSRETSTPDNHQCSENEES